jgi:hypothetical protein
MYRMLAYGPMSRTLAALLLLSLPALAKNAPQDAWKPFSISLDPKQVHEECQRVEKGEKRRYHWKSDAPVDFNVHYHKQTEVFYPLKRGAMRGDGGTFTAKSGEEYCWMWTARDKPAKVEGRVESR